MPTVSSKFIVPNTCGLHARPAAMFVKTAGRYTAAISVKNGDGQYNGKSILELLSIGAEKGTQLTVIAEGHDADAAMKEIECLFAGAFGEKLR